ncbi:MAG: WbuC family cupin fold metalloprotein [Verrucomicrobiae bacterium]|jgi:cupin fold WbuC family metalloprotein|nr:WbuC family cupin fold metalloprotein [Verrucomicrobiae bacterium]
MITEIDDALFSDLLSKAEESPRRRAHHVFHQSHDELVQRLCIALRPGTYVRPHNHHVSGKWELLLVLRGRVELLEFADDGRLLSRRTLSADSGLSAVELSANTWHSLIPTGDEAVIMEVKQGPFAATAPEEFAAWSPEEGAPEVASYLAWSAKAELGDVYRPN